MQAFVYIRFSTKRQERGASWERQLEDCRTYCDRKGWPVVEVIEDLGQSAWSGAHLTSGKLGEFAERVRTGEIRGPAVLVVERLDRLSRQEPLKALRWLQEMCDAGISVADASRDDVYDTATLNADLLAPITILLGAQNAHDESEKKSERVLDAANRSFQRALAEKRVMTAKCPAWLVAREDRTGFQVVEAVANVVREIYAMAAEGRGPGWIAAEMNDRGVPAFGKRKDARPGKWQLSTVSLLLRHPCVEGDHVPGFANTNKVKRTQRAEVVYGYYPRIVDADLVARARAAMNARKIGPRGLGTGRYARNVANLFAGHVLCGCCGGKMNIRVNGDVPPQVHLQCTGALQRRGCDQREMFRYRELERDVLDAVLHRALDDRYFARPADAYALAAKLAEVEKKIADAKDGERRLIEVMVRVTTPQIEQRAAELNREAVALKGECARLQAELSAAQGAVSPVAHLERVREFRAAMEGDDVTARQTARLHVQQAFRAIGLQIACHVVGSERFFSVLLGDGAFGLDIRNGGGVIRVRDDFAAGVQVGDTPEEIAWRADHHRRTRTEALLEAGGVTGTALPASDERRAALTAHARRVLAKR